MQRSIGLTLLLILTFAFGAIAQRKSIAPAEITNDFIIWQFPTGTVIAVLDPTKEREILLAQCKEPPCAHEQLGTLWALEPLSGKKNR